MQAAADCSVLTTVPKQKKKKKHSTTKKIFHGDVPELDSAAIKIPARIAFSYWL